MLHCNHRPRQQPSRSPILSYALFFLRTRVENVDGIIAAVHVSVGTVGNVLMTHLLWSPRFARLGMQVIKGIMPGRMRIHCSSFTDSVLILSHRHVPLAFLRLPTVFVEQKASPVEAVMPVN